LTHLEWGGVEAEVYETGRRLPDHGVDTEVMCPNVFDDAERERMGGLDVSRYPYFYPYLGLARPRRKALDQKGGELFSFSLLRSLIETPEVDLIHLHAGGRLAGIGRRAARKKGIGYIVSLHGRPLEGFSGETGLRARPTQNTLDYGKVLDWWTGARRALADADAVLCLSRAERDRVLADHPDQRVEMVPAGVDVQRYKRGRGRRFRDQYRIDPDVPLVLSVGRIEPQKNQALAVETLSELVRSGAPDAHWAFIGSITNRDYYNGLSARVDALGLKDHVTFIPGLPPYGPDMVDAYHAADAFCLTSSREPFGIVVLEAWGAGRPVVSSALGGPADLIRDGEDGLLAEPGQRESFAEALGRILTDSELARKLGNAGQKRAEAEYSWDAVTARLAGLYRSVLTARAS
jgi:glycosyltransferase involved in cell wall biosynthesis